MKPLTPTAKSKLLCVYFLYYLFLSSGFIAIIILTILALEHSVLFVLKRLSHNKRNWETRDGNTTCCVWTIQTYLENMLENRWRQTKLVSILAKSFPTPKFRVKRISELRATMGIYFSNQRFEWWWWWWYFKYFWKTIFYVWFLTAMKPLTPTVDSK